MRAERKHLDCLAALIAALFLLAPGQANAGLLDLLGLGPTQSQGAANAPAAVGTGQALAPTAPAAAQATAQLQPFGANIFTSAPGAPTLTDNANYIIQVGDSINIRIWGGVTAESTAIVDTQGNVFLTDVGPIHVAGVRSGDLEATVRREVATSYTSNVQVYAVLQGTHQVGIFVTGFVKAPGRYMGAASDSVIDYLQRAGGVDPSRGSYRNITLQRHGKVIAQIDLYQFLLSGTLPPVNLKQDDAIVVARQYPMVAVGGTVRNNYLFELPDVPTEGRIIIDLARPLPAATHAFIKGTRNAKPYAIYVTLKDLQTTPLYDQDEITFLSDVPAETVSVQIEGSRIGPSVLVVDRDNRLPSLLNYVAVDSRLADTKSIYVMRQSVADMQRRSMDEAISRLQKSLFYATSVTTGEAQIRASEAQLIESYIERARQITPEGRLVVTDEDGRLADIRLEDNDKIVIPEKSQVVMVSGEVLLPQAVIYSPDLSAADYVARAGGFTERGRSGNYLIRRANGRIYLDSSMKLRPGDELIVLPYIDSKNFQLVKDFVQVLYEIAVTAHFGAAL